MKKIIVILNIVCILLSCSKNNEIKQTLSNMNNPVLTSDNFVEIISRQIKHYPKEPLYQVYVKNSLCLYEVLVNDLPVGKLFEYSQQATPYDLNPAILKSGRQKITLRLYPAPEEYSRSGNVLSPNVLCSLEIVSVDNKDAEFTTTTVAKFNLPTKVRMAGQNNNVEIPEFEGEGKNYYEITFEFDATIPYENQGWSNGQDLSKLDQKKLEEATLKFYQSQWDLYNSRDLNGLLKFMYRKEIEVRSALYNNKQDLIKVLNAYKEPIISKYYKEQPIINFKRVFYGNHRIVTLQHASDDINLKNESALWGIEESPSDGKTYFFNYRYLYLPKGKNLEDGLEVIR